MKKVAVLVGLLVLAVGTPAVAVAAGKNTGARTVRVQPAVDPVSTTIDGTLHTPDGRDRTFHVYVPSTIVPGSVSGAPVPLLVALHGGTGWGAQFETNSGFDGFAEANRFIVVYPDGIGIGANGTALRTWNGVGCCGPAARENVDDVGFIRLLIQQLESQYPIDPARVFAAGHSNGGILAYKLACELADQIVAIGVQSSSLEQPECRPSKPVSVIHIHGTADQNLPINGGKGPNGISGVTFNPAIDGLKKLAAADKCPAHPSTKTDATNPDLTIVTWRPCRGATEVEFIKVKGAPHAWMGHPTAIARAVGTPYSKLDSSLVVLQFLLAHPRV